MSCGLFIKYGIVLIGVKSDWKDGLWTAVPACRQASTRPVSRKLSGVVWGVHSVIWWRSHPLDVCCVSYDKDGGRSSDEGF